MVIRVLRGVRLCRIQAAINAGVVKDVYKTQLCAKGYCRRLHCTYYHDASDRLLMIGYNAQYCKAYKVSPFCFHSLLSCALLPYSKGMPLRLENIRIRPKTFASDYDNGNTFYQAWEGAPISAR